MTNQVISANRLDNGTVVYLTAYGDWTERLALLEANQPATE